MGVWGWVRNGSSKAYPAEEQMPRTMLRKHISSCLEICPILPVLSIRDKLSCHSKDEMHSLILIFHAVQCTDLWLELTKELLLNGTVRTPKWVFLNYQLKKLTSFKILHLFFSWNDSACVSVLCLKSLPAAHPKNFPSWLSMSSTWLPVYDQMVFSFVNLDLFEKACI